jgi:hypothetical protein
LIERLCERLIALDGAAPTSDASYTTTSTNSKSFSKANRSRSRGPFRRNNKKGLM